MPLVSTGTTGANAEYIRTILPLGGHGGWFGSETAPKGAALTAAWRRRASFVTMGANLAARMAAPR